MDAREDLVKQLAECCVTLVIAGHKSNRGALYVVGSGWEAQEKGRLDCRTPSARSLRVVEDGRCKQRKVKQGGGQSPESKRRLACASSFAATWGVRSIPGLMHCAKLTPPLVTACRWSVYSDGSPSSTSDRMEPEM
jgi:hypothetical protein